MEKSELQQKIEEKGIVISRVPEWARDIFKQKGKQRMLWGLWLVSFRFDKRFYGI